MWPARVARLLGELLQVVAGTEGAAGAGQHDRAIAESRVRLVERGVQVGEQRARDRVQPVGAVERDDGDGVATLEPDEGHG